MRTQNLAYLGLAVLLSTAACHHAVPVAANHPPDTTPVPPPSSSTPATPRSSGPQAARPSQPVAQTPRSTAIPPEVRATLNEKLARLEDAMFDYDKSTIRADASTALKDDVGVIRDILANYPTQKLMIEGHCDERGSEEYNMALGDRRAKATEEFLSSMGIPGAQLTVISFGKDRPVCTSPDEDCYQKNRRAHMTAAP